MDRKIKIVTLGDHPLSPSGVGTQTKYFVEGLLKTGKYQFLSIGGAIKHKNYQPVKTEEWGEDWVIHPVDGYGNKDLIRGLIRAEKPDILWLMTDPRFWIWLWEIENEVRPNVPMIYYHVWDNYPYPTFNQKYYDSNDFIVSISKVTDDIVKTVAPNTPSRRIGHVVSPAFCRQDPHEVKAMRITTFGKETENKLLFFWNNRNARRKQSGSLVYWFKKFLDRVGHDKAALIMHTDPKDEHGQDLEWMIRELKLTNRQVLLSTEKVPPHVLANIYNMVDCTINVSDAEGFGLSTLESLACGTPIIVNMTGGLQEQVTDGENWFGIGLEPTSKAVIGSQPIPMIYEDRLSEEVVVGALIDFFNLSPQEREEMGRLGRQHVETHYNLEANIRAWDEVISEVVDRCGAWETRKNYKGWQFEEVKKIA